MQHKKLGRRLHRSSSHRRALLNNLAKELIRYEQITTTLPKAKELKRYIDKIITLGKKGELHRRRATFGLLRDETLVNKVFDVLAKRYSARPGGYTRLLKYGFRTGDAAPLAIIEFIDRDVTAKPKGPKQNATGDSPVVDATNQAAPKEIIKADKKNIMIKKDSQKGNKMTAATQPKIRKNIAPQ